MAKCSSEKLVADNHLPKVAIIILNYFSTSDTIRCLDSLSRINYPNVEVILIDNMSCNNDFEALRKICKHSFHAIKLEKNYGACVGRNLGTKVAFDNGAEYFFYLDNDTIVEPNVLIELIEVIDKNPCIGAVQPQVRLLDSNMHQLPRQRPHFHPVEDYLLLGCALLVKREAMGQVGVFDPTYFYYCEDTDWLLRLRKTGYTAQYIPTRARVFHKCSYTPKWIKLAFALRNRFLLIRRYEPILRWPISIWYNLITNGVPILEHGRIGVFVRALFEGVRLMFSNPPIGGLSDLNNCKNRNAGFVRYLTYYWNGSLTT